MILGLNNSQTTHQNKKQKYFCRENNVTSVDFGLFWIFLDLPTIFIKYNPFGRGCCKHLFGLNEFCQAILSIHQGIYGAVSDGGIMAVITMLSAVLFSKYHTTAFLAMGGVSLVGCIGSLALWKWWDGKELPVL